MSNITFPGLGWEFNPPRGFTVPGTDFTIYFYGVIIALGLVLSVVYGLRRSRQFGLKQDDILDGVLWIVPLAIVCARAYYVIFEIDQYHSFADVINIRKGGLAIYGGVIGAALGVVIFAKVKKVSLPAVLDLVGIAFLIGQSIGRWGNFINREAYGAPTEFFLRMGLVVGGEQGYYHPTFLYESVWNALGFVLLHFLSKKRQYDGQMALGYAAWYGLGRTFIEGLRMDSLYWGPFRVSQLLAAVSCLVAVVTLLVMNFRSHDRSKLFVRYVDKMEAAEEAAKKVYTQE
jgi:phosphatidylglycerol:prolipoprotein diacylglycerol transferase